MIKEDNIGDKKQTSGLHIYGNVDTTCHLKQAFHVPKCVYTPMLMYTLVIQKYHSQTYNRLTFIV